MLSEKQKKLLELLLKQQGIVTVETYSKLLGVSKRSIYTYLNILESYLSAKGLKIKKIPSKGIEIIEDKDGSIDNNLQIDDYSIVARRRELISRLFIQDEVIDIEDFCEEYFVSSSSIRNDALYLDSLLANLDINVIIKKGKMFHSESSEVHLINAISHISEQMTYGLSFEEKLEYYRSIFEPDIVDTVVDIISTYISSLNLNIAEHYIVHICSIMIALVTRAKRGKHIIIDNNLLDYDRLQMMADILLAKQFLGSIGLKLNIEFTDGDVTFISNYLVADRIQISNFSKIAEDDLVIFKRILKKFEKILDIELDEGDELVSNLLLHLNAMVFRLRNNIQISNDLIENIKLEFGALFDLAWIVLESEREQLKIEITDDEVGFLIIHLQNIIEQQKKSKNILLVCPHGVVTSNLILNKIREIIPAYNFIEVISLDRVKEVSLESIDFIITTSDLPALNKPVLRVSPILTREDIKNILSFYQGIILNSQDEIEDKYDKLLEYLDDENIYELDLDNKEAIIDTVCQSLFKKGVVFKGYRESMHYRETLGPTDNQCQ